MSTGHSLCQGLVSVLEQPQLVAGLLLGLEQGVEAGGLVRGLVLEKLAKRVRWRRGRPREPRVTA